MEDYTALGTFIFLSSRFFFILSIQVVIYLFYEDYDMGSSHFVSA
jgi:hypothetical protein